MPRDVGDGFGNDSVGGNLHRGGQSDHLALCLDADVEEGASIAGRLGQGGDLQADRRDEAEFVERGRSQALDETANVRDARLGLGMSDGELPGGALRIGTAQRGHGLDLHGDPGKHRAEAIVEVAPNTAPLVLARAHELLTRPLQVLRQPDGANDNGKVGRQAGEESDIRAREPLPLTRNGDDAAHHLALHRESRDDRINLLRRGVRLIAPDLDAGSLQLQRRDQRGRQGRKHIMDGIGFTDGLSHALHDRLGVAAVAVQEAIGDTLQELAERCEGNGHRRRRQQRLGSPEVVTDQRGGSLHHSDVEPDERHGQRGEHQRAIDDDVDVEQVVAEHCDGDGGAERCHTERLEQVRWPHR